jgi:predicted nucleic acid-binding protein
MLAHHTPVARLVNDAYLAAFAMASGRRLATLDRGFRRFTGLQVELIEA